MIIAMRTSIAGEGSTEPNLYFACGKMQTDSDSPPIKKTTLLGGLFYWHRHLEGGI